MATESRCLRNRVVGTVQRHSTRAAGWNPTQQAGTQRAGSEPGLLSLEPDALLNDLGERHAKPGLQAKK